MRSPSYLGRAPVTTGPGQLPRIRLEEVAAVELELPDLSKQRRVVGAITNQVAAVERARAAAEAQLEAAKSLPAAYLRRIFSGPLLPTWRQRTLGELCEIQLGKMLSPASRQGSGPRPYLRNANVQWNRFDLSSILAMDFSDAEAEKFELRSGDILVCEGGEPGRAAVWEGQVRPCYYQKALHRLRVRDDTAVPQFIVYRLWFSSLVREFVEAHAKTTIAHLPAVRLERLPMAVPPIAEQRRLVSVLDEQFAAAGRLQQGAEGQLRMISAAPAILLRRAFSGEA
jgi:type I restriction enzyme S subunit